MSVNTNENPSSSKGDNSPTKDKLFDPSIDMLIHDYDDERTLEEEEAMAAGETNDHEAELSNLEKEGNMPLEELLALYGYNKGNSSPENNEEEDEDNNCESIVENDSLKRQSKLTLLYQPIVENMDDSTNLMSVSRLSDDDCDSNSDDDEKLVLLTILVGNDYQAQVPEGLCSYKDVPANDNDDVILWKPHELSNEDIEEYLRKTREITKTPINKEAILRDNEEVLYFLHECGYNIKEALQKLEKEGPSILKPLNVNEKKWWPEEEELETQLVDSGKDFLQIRQKKVT